MDDFKTNEIIEEIKLIYKSSMKIHNDMNVMMKSIKLLRKKTYKVVVSDISTFFTTSTRDNNDAINKVREEVLKVICNPPKEYLENIQFGKNWCKVYEEFKKALEKIAQDTQIPTYTRTEIEVKGGRNFNYDANIMYYNETNIVATRKIEFKKGGINIDELAQFLSLQVKFGLFSETYDKFWYEKYLDKYIKLDTGITEVKPSLEVYLKNVSNTKYSITPFFEQLKQRELICQKEKNTIVNNSITEYLTKFGSTIDIDYFAKKVKDTQKDKIYLLWTNEKFYLDKLSEIEMTNMRFHSIKNGNIIELKTNNTIYSLLLRWRNHKGILNPAWQISMKRQK